MWPFRKKPEDPLVAAVRGLQSEIERFRQEIRSFTNVTARYVFPQNAMDDLTGELRALRQLLDKDGKYAVLDSIREKRRMEEARELGKTSAEVRP